MSASAYGGFPIDSFVDRAAAKEFECAICTEVLRDAMVLPCGHELCTVCVDSLSSRGSQTCVCPLCRASLPRAEAAKAYNTRRKVDAMQVRCRYFKPSSDEKDLDDDEKKAVTNGYRSV